MASSRRRTADVLVRNLDATVLEVFRRRAERNGRSIQAELHLSLAREAQRNFDEAVRISERWHAALSDRAASSDRPRSASTPTATISPPAGAPARKPAKPFPRSRDLIAEDRRR